MARALLPPAIADERFGALATLHERLDALPLSVLLVYRLDQVVAGALIHLGNQFHVMGDEGWNFALTEGQKRQLIRDSIAIHRTRGTIGALHQAITQAGFPEHVVIENPVFDLALLEPGVLPAFYYDGTFAYNGRFTMTGIAVLVRNGRLWGTFVIVLPDDADFDQLPLLYRLVEVAKNIRSWLLRVQVGVNLADAGFVSDALEITQTTYLLYDAAVVWDGGYDYDGVAEVVIL
ncbi:MAG: hypothetical protein OHK0012_07410 [Synechococcales cyanobacterium]